MPDARTVADVMTRDVICVPAWATFQEIERILVEYRVRAVPVVDGAHIPLGSVSEMDLARARERDRRTHHPRRDRARSRTRVDHQCAGDLMDTAPITVGVDTDVRSAARLLGHAGVTWLVVVDSFGRLAGVVSRRDMVRAYGRTGSGSFSIHGTLLPDVHIPRPR
jgi:CBS domain-containing protein